MSEEKIDIEVLLDIVRRWRKLGYTEEETRRFYDAVVANLSHLSSKELAVTEMQPSAPWYMR